MDSDRTEERRPRRHALKESAKKNAKSGMLGDKQRKESRLEISQPPGKWTPVFFKNIGIIKEPSPSN